jgi:hypothetical protein
MALGTLGRAGITPCCVKLIKSEVMLKAGGRNGN